LIKGISAVSKVSAAMIIATICSNLPLLIGVVPDSIVLISVVEDAFCEGSTNRKVIDHKKKSKAGKAKIKIIKCRMNVCQKTSMLLAHKWSI
jgi:hypothetical protein